MSANRTIILANQQIYHVYNRGVERRMVFTGKREYERMMMTLWFYRHTDAGSTLSAYLNLSTEERQVFAASLVKKSMRVSILAYCLMPNHFHLILRQEVTHGISRFVANVSNSYTKFFNIKRARVGPLFQGTFKAVLVETDEQFRHLTRYVHLNPVSSFLIKPEELESYSWSSYGEYLGKATSPLCDIKQVKALTSLAHYRSFILDQAAYQQELEKIKHLSLEK